MPKERKLKCIRWFVAITILLAFISLLSLIELKWPNAKIAERAGGYLRAEVSIASTTFSLFPIPHFALRGVNIKSPKWGRAVVPAVRFYPRLLSLFMGEIRPRKICAVRPQVDLVVDKGAIVEEDLIPYLEGKVLRQFPSLEVEGGEVNLLRREGGSIMTAQGVMMQLSAGKRGYLQLSLNPPWGEWVEIAVYVGGSGKRRYTVRVAGRGLRVEGVRGVLLELLGRYESVQRLCSIVRGGRLDWITIEGAGGALAEAVDFERNVRIKGAFAKGRFIVPPGPLPLEEGAGSFEIEEAVLRCHDAEARIGKSNAKRVELVVGLIKERAAFHLEGEIDADAADLAHYLPLIIKQEGLREEIARFRQVAGRGQGRLLLGETIGDIRPKVEIDDFRLSFRHASSEGRVFLDGGRLKLNEDKGIWGADRVVWRGGEWRGIKGGVIFTRGGIKMEVTQADLCGISCQGTIVAHGGKITYSFRFGAEGADLASTIGCLWGKDARIDGGYVLEAGLFAEGGEDPIREASQGDILFISKGGRIRRWTILAQLFNMLNVIGMIKGKLPDFTEEGFAYDTFVITGELRDGYLYLNEAVIDSGAMKIVGEGKVDLIKGEADIVVLIAPLGTVDNIMSHIPVLGKIITGKQGTFISFPFSVNGPIRSPQVTLLPPEAVGSGLWGVLKRTLQAPLNIFRTIISKR